MSRRSPPVLKHPGATEHGAVRAKERLGLNRQALARHVARVLREGLREHQLTGRVAREMRIRKMKDGDRPVDYVLFQNDIYCFTPTGELITVLKRKLHAGRGPRRNQASDPDNDDYE